MWVEPVTLQGTHVRLEPLEERHAADLAEQVDMDIYRYFAAVRPLTADEAGMRGFIREVRALPDVLGFAIVLQSTGEAVGSTTYMDIRAPHRGLEIGMTWIGRQHQGTKVNPEAKMLMLQHAVEVLDSERVQLKCDKRNLQSQAAILKLGAKFEGCLRKHFILPDGFVRDTMMYSIVKEEWPEVKARLIARLAATG